MKGSPGPRWAMHWPRATRVPASPSAASAKASTSVVLPMPASPVTKTTRRSPASASACNAGEEQRPAAAPGPPGRGGGRRGPRAGRLPRCGKGGRVGVEPGVLAKDAALQLAQLRRRLDPQLLGQGPPCLLVGGERLRLAARAIEGEHLAAPQALPGGAARDRVQLGDQFGVAAEREVGLDPLLEGREAQLLQPVGLDRANGSENSARAGAPPHGQRAPQADAEAAAWSLSAAASRASRRRRSNRRRSMSSGGTSRA